MVRADEDDDEDDEDDEDDVIMRYRREGFGACSDIDDALLPDRRGG